MIKRQVLGRKFFAAVLTGVIVPSVNIRPGELYFVLILHADIFQKPDDRRQFDGKRDGMNFAVVFLNDLDLARKEQSEGFLPGDDPEWFVRRV
jgi:hypothetical protein